MLGKSHTAFMEILHSNHLDICRPNLFECQESVAAAFIDLHHGELQYHAAVESLLWRASRIDILCTAVLC